MFIHMIFPIPNIFHAKNTLLDIQIDRNANHDPHISTKYPCKTKHYTFHSTSPSIFFLIIFVNLNTNGAIGVTSIICILSQAKYCVVVVLTIKIIYGERNIVQKINPNIASTIQCLILIPHHH